MPLNQMADKAKTKLRSMSSFQRLVLSFVFFFIVSVFVTAKAYAMLNGHFEANYFESLVLTLTSFYGVAYNAVFSAVLLIILIVLSRRNNDLNGVKTTDERGVSISNAGTYGTSEWMAHDEAKSVYEVCPVEECKGTILGQFSDDGEEVIALPYKRKSNRNLILIGPPGAGKSFGFVRSAVFQSIKRNESLVCSDPKAEIHNDMRKLLEAHGYEVKLFNLINLQKSDAWDCVREIYDPQTGDIDERRVVIFCETIMTNSNASNKEDEFWTPGEKNLLKVAVLYNAFVREQTLIKLYERYAKELLDRLDYISPEDRKSLQSIMEDSETYMNERREIVLNLAKRVYSTDEMAEEYVKKIEQQAPTCTMSDIYFSLLHKDLEQWEQCFSVVPLTHPAASAWAIFKGSGDRVQPGIVTGLAQRLQLFQLRDVRRIVCNDDIRLEDIGARKTALFLVISDDNASMQMISSLMFSFLFKDLKEAYDLVEGKGRIPVNIIADEMTNTGVWPQFEKTMATARSREISVSIILQSLPQLSLLYGENIAEIIIGCCNTILVLGCNDEYTAKYISNLSGVATIRATSVRDNRASSVGYRHLNQGYSLSEGDGKRNLMNPDEVRGLKEDEILIYTNGQHLLKAKRFGFILHPYASDPAFIPTRWSEISDSKDKYRLTENQDAFARVADVQNLHVANQQIISSRAVQSHAPAKATSGSKGKKTKNAEEQVKKEETGVVTHENAFARAHNKS